MKSLSTTPPAAVASLEKALVLFDRIVRDRGDTPLRELAGDLGLSRSTLYRLAGTLQEFGLITRHARGYYGVGLPLTARLQGLTVANRLAQLSRPPLQSLADECGSTAHLGVLEDGMVTYVVKVVDKNAGPGAVFTRENAQLEAYCSAIGKVLLAWLPEAERDRYLAAGPFVPLTSRTITDSGALRDCLNDVRRDGFAQDDGEVADDLFCLAVPVPGQNLPVSTAISISFERSTRHLRNTAETLKKLGDCAAELSARLGG